MPSGSFDELQRQALEMLKAQQEAYLDAVRAWQESVSSGQAKPAEPEIPPLDSFPNPSEIAEASAAFTAKLLDEQRRFMQQLSETLAESKKNR